MLSIWCCSACRTSSKDTRWDILSRYILPVPFLSPLPIFSSLLSLYLLTHNTLLPSHDRVPICFLTTHLRIHSCFFSLHSFLNTLISLLSSLMILTLLLYCVCINAVDASCGHQRDEQSPLTRHRRSENHRWGNSSQLQGICGKYSTACMSVPLMQSWLRMIRYHLFDHECIWLSYSSVWLHTTFCLDVPIIMNTTVTNEHSH